MYRTDVKNIPQAIKDHFMECLFDNGYSNDEIISLDEKPLSMHSSKEICCFNQNSFPDFWLITFKDDAERAESDVFYVIFETALTKHQEDMFFDAMKKHHLFEFIASESMSETYGIY